MTATCNLCEGNDLTEVVDVPQLPISKDYSGSPFRFDLKLHYCEHCGLVQICEPISPDELYSSHLYLTGFQKPKHIDDLIISALQFRDPGAFIEIGCNDGSIMRDIAPYGFTHLTGVEPNRYAAAHASEHAKVYNDYLNTETAEKISSQCGQFDFVLCRHVVEHVSNLKDFFHSLRHLLSDDGLLILELPRIELGFEAGCPTILFEEHVNHFTESCLRSALHHYGFEVLDRKYYAFGGGSIAMICKKADMAPLIPDISLLAKYFHFYGDGLYENKRAIHALLTANDDKYIALYGAASRASMFINVMGIADKIDYVFDDRTEIHGLIMPGTSKKITGFKDTGKDTICLLGIGPESEWKVKNKFSKTVSLFAPRFNSNNFC